MENFFKIGYWFDMKAGSLHPPIQKLLILVIIALFSMSFLIFILKKAKGPYKTVWIKLYSFGIANFFIELILFLANRR